MCRETIGSAYNDEILRDVSDDGALQLLADILFLEIALKGEISGAKEKFVEKVLCSF